MIIVETDTVKSPGSFLNLVMRTNWELPCKRLGSSFKQGHYSYSATLLAALTFIREETISSSSA